MYACMAFFVIYRIATMVDPAKDSEDLRWVSISLGLEDFLRVTLRSIFDRSFVTS